MKPSSETESNIDTSKMEDLVKRLGRVAENGIPYHLSDEFDKCLNEISKLLAHDDEYRSNNLTLATIDALELHFLPVLTTLANHQCNKSHIQMIITIMANMTLPLECCSPGCMAINPIGNSMKIQNALLQYKKAFLVNHESTALLVKFIRMYAVNYNEHLAIGDGQKDLDTIIANNSLVLIRNLLHVPAEVELTQFEPYKSQNRTQCPFECPCCDGDNNPREEWQGIYRKLVWNLLAQGIDDAILSVLNLKDHQVFNQGLVQLITLLFKDQPVLKLQQILQSGRILRESSDDDLESDSSSSIQRSSSSSLMSGGCSSPSSSQSLAQIESNENEKWHSKTSDSGVSCEQRTSGDDTSSSRDASDIRKECDSSKDEIIDEKEISNVSSASDEASDAHVVNIDSNEVQAESPKENITKMANKSYSDTNELLPPDGKNISKAECHRDTQMHINRQKDIDVSDASATKTTAAATVTTTANASTSTTSTTTTMVDNTSNSSVTGSNETACSDVVKRSNTREEQTSGISNGSSEEETRITRKVIKSHHRTVCQRNESDSSEEYNKKPQASNDSQCRKGRLQSSGYLPNMLRSKCSPSVCLEAAMVTTTKSSSSIASPVIAPWEKKKIYKSFPLDLDSFVPSNEDIGKLLKDFVYKFLHNAFAKITLELSDQLIGRKINLDLSHFLWLISYFVNLAVAIDLEYHHIESLMCPTIFGYLVYQGVTMNEDLEILVLTKPMDFATTTLREKRKILLRKMHLIVSALRELFHAIIKYSQKCRGKEERLALKNLRYTLAEMTDLRQLLLLYIRCFVPTIHSKQFLVEVIITHHIAMILLEPVYLEGRFDLPLHLKQFATMQVMDHYGKVLQDFKTNSDFVNDCVLTLMHHVAGDLMAPEVLFQPIILKTFSLIMDSELEVKECWGQLIDYIMIRFVRAAKKSPSACIRTMFGEASPSSCVDSTDATVSHTSHDSLSLVLVPSCELNIGKIRDDRDRLYWLYLQYEQAEDPIGMIADALVDEFNVHIEKCEVLAQLVAKGIVDKHECDVLVAKSEIENICSGKWFAASKVKGEHRDALDALIEKISKTEMKQQVLWVQEVLLKCGSVKVAVRGSDVIPYTSHAVPFFSNVLAQSTPIVPYNEKQEMALSDSTFIRMLQLLGLDLPEEVHRLYPRVPSFIRPEILYNLSVRLAHVDGTILQPKYLEAMVPSSDGGESSNES